MEQNFIHGLALIRLSGTEPGTEEDRRKVIRGGGGGGTKKYSCKGKATEANEKNSCSSSYLQHHSSHKFYHSPRHSGPWRADRVRSWNSGYRLQRKSCLRVCLSILQKVDHNRGVSALTILIKVKHLLCIFFSSASPTKSMQMGIKAGCG